MYYRTIFILLLQISFTNIHARDFLTDSVSYLALGDSYTIGESVDSTLKWPVQFIDSLSSRGKVITKYDIRATTGWTTSSLLNNIANKPIKEKYNIVSLLIGVNNFYQNLPESLYIKDFAMLLDSITKYCSAGKQGLFVLSIPDYGYSPFGYNNQENISKNTDRYNFIGDSISTAYGIDFINITDISRKWTSNPDLITDDLLHPSGKQYSLWVKRLLSIQVNTVISERDGYSKIARKIGIGRWQFLSEVLVQVVSLSGKIIFSRSFHANEKANLSMYTGSIITLTNQSNVYSFVIY